MAGCLSRLIAELGRGITMKLTVSVRVDGMYTNTTACMDLPEPLVRVFAPLKTADDPLLSALFHEPQPESVAVKEVYKMREEAAKEIADAITKHLIREMSKNDTHNGCAA